MFDFCQSVWQGRSARQPVISRVCCDNERCELSLLKTRNAATSLNRYNNWKGICLLFGRAPNGKLHETVLLMVENIHSDTGTEKFFPSDWNIRHFFYGYVCCCVSQLQAGLLSFCLNLFYKVLYLKGAKEIWAFSWFSTGCVGRQDADFHLSKHC